MSAMKPLQGIRVIDLSDWLGAYPGRLFADLGAEVIRVEPPGGSARRFTPPLLADGISAGFAFTEAGKSSVMLDVTDPADAGQIHRLLASAQVLVTSQGPAILAAGGLDTETTSTRYPGLIHLAISPFGQTGPDADRPATDLTLLAAGGLLALGGDPDREPVRPWGEQSSVIVGVHAATAALIALLVLESTGCGQVVDVSAQEAIAHSTENAVQYFDLEDVVRLRAGAGPVEAGTGLFQCLDGWVYLVGGLGGRPLAWEAIIEWLESSGVVADPLREPRWQERDFRCSAAAVEQFRAMFEGFAAGRTKRELHEEGQCRGISIAAVATATDVLDSPQLVDRDFFRDVEIAGRAVRFPGSPYRMTDTANDLQIGPGPIPMQIGTPSLRNASAHPLPVGATP